MKCAICGGKTRLGRTTVSVDRGEGLVVVRGVPANICVQCGEEWIADQAASRVEEIVQRAKREKSQIEVVALATA
jgi:YgiT-type zinc finger domain-containing protein